MKTGIFFRITRFSFARNEELKSQKASHKHEISLFILSSETFLSALRHAMTSEKKHVHESFVLVVAVCLNI